jgi:hypothetical protein
VCVILTADLPGHLGVFDERQFTLVIPSSLPAGERTALARNLFEEAGMVQDGETVTCLCGLEAEFPREIRKARTWFARPAAGWRPVLMWTLLFVVVAYTGDHAVWIATHHHHR